MDLGGSTSSRSRGASDRREAPVFPSNVRIVDTDTAFETTKTQPTWPEPEWGIRTEIQNVNEKTCEGTFLAAGTMFPLGESQSTRL